MKRRYYIPTKVLWNAEPGAQEKARLEQAIFSAIHRAVESSSGGVPDIVIADFDVPEHVGEPFSFTRYHLDRDSYSVPSYQDGGASTEIPVEEAPPTFETADIGPIPIEFESDVLQAKLSISQPDDKYEQEADRVAEQVMRMPEPQAQLQPEEEEKEELLQPKPLVEQITPLVQRQIEPEEEEEEPIQTKLTDSSQLQRLEEELEEEEPGQTKPIGTQTSRVSSGVESWIHSLKAGGQSLSDSERAFFEPQFGRDFSPVRIHTDSRAAHTAQELNAQAFTYGADAFYGAGRYQPATPSGKRPLAHELTHVLQQRGNAEVSSTLQRNGGESSLASVSGEIIKDTPGPVTNKDDSGFSLRIDKRPHGRYYYFRWAVRDANGNAYRMRCVDGNYEVWEYGHCKHAYINKPTITAMRKKNAGLGCRVLCLVLETDSPEVPGFYYPITETNSRVFSINFDFLPKPNLQKIETLFEHLKQEKWDVDTLAAKLTDSEMLTLTLNKRISLISYIAEGSIVGDEDEKTLVRLIATTPSQDTRGLFDSFVTNNTKLYKRLEKVIHGEEYKKYQQLLRSKFPETMEPEEAWKKIETAKLLPWAAPGVIHSYWNSRFYYEDVSITDDGKIHIEGYQSYIFKISEIKLDLEPNELIGVHFFFEEEHVGAPRGKTVYMPAINFFDLYNKQFRQEARLVADIGLLALGGVGLVGATTKLGKFIAALDFAFGTADFTINEFRNDIAKSEAGRAFLKVWDKFLFLYGAYGMTRVALRVPSAFDRVKDSFKKFRTSKLSLKRDELTKLDGKVNNFLKKADEATEEAKNLKKTKETPTKPSPEETKSELEATLEVAPKWASDKLNLSKSILKDLLAARQPFRQVYEQLQEAGWRASGRLRAIWPDPHRYPTVEIRPNGDVFGSHSDVLRYVRETRLGGTHQVGESTIQVHHLLENRLMKWFGILRREGRSVTVEAFEHTVFSRELPRYLPRGHRFYDIDHVFEAHAMMYRAHGYAEWVEEMHYFLRQHRDHVRSLYERGKVPGINQPDFTQRKQRVLRFLDNL